MPLGASRLSFLAYQAAEAAGRTAITLTAQQDVQVSTAQSKFGGASAYFDGSGDYLSASAGDVPAFGTGDFTIEYWMRWDNMPVANGYMSWEQRPGSNGAYPLIFHGNGGDAGNIRFFVNSADRIVAPSGTISVDTWHHIAVVRNSGTTKMYVDGVQKGSSYTDSTDYQAGRLYLGANMNGINSLDGWMDEIRASSIARYTGNFTPPTAAFVNDANTLLLIHADGADGSTTFTDDASAPGQAATGGVYSLPSVYFNEVNNTGYQTTANSLAANPGSVTVSVLVNPRLISRDSYITFFAASNPSLSLFVETTGQIRWFMRNTLNSWVDIRTNTGAIVANQWQLITMSYDVASSNYHIAINGVIQAISSVSAVGTTPNWYPGSNLTVAIGSYTSQNDSYDVDADIAYVYVHEQYLDLTQNNNIDFFWNTSENKPKYLGTNGTATGLPTPYVYHSGNTSTFPQNQGSWTYTFTNGLLNYPVTGSNVDTWDVNA
jgi:hypothetical protein